jgi:hypothetical protein
VSGLFHGSGCTDIKIRFKNPEKGRKKKEARKYRNADWKRKETTNEEK